MCVRGIGRSCRGSGVCVGLVRGVCAGVPRRPGVRCGFRPRSSGRCPVPPAAGSEGVRDMAKIKRKHHWVVKNKCGLYLGTLMDRTDRWIDAACTCPDFVLHGKDCYLCPKRIRFMRLYASRTKARITGWDHFVQSGIRYQAFKAAGGCKGTAKEIHENWKAFQAAGGVWESPAEAADWEKKMDTLEKYFL